MVTRRRKKKTSKRRTTKRRVTRRRTTKKTGPRTIHIKGLGTYVKKASKRRKRTRR